MKGLNKQISLVVLLVILSLLSFELVDDGWGFIQNMNLIIHEAGHLLFAFASPTLVSFMGSGLEVLVPLVFAIYFLYNNNLLGTVFSIWWTGTALIHVGVYMADAVVRVLPLLGGSHVTHDWNFIFLQWGVLKQSEPIGNFVTTLGWLFIIIALGLLIIHIVNSYRSSAEE